MDLGMRMKRFIAVLLLVSAVRIPALGAQEVRVAEESAEADSAEAEEEKIKRDPKFRVEFSVSAEVLFTMIRLRYGVLPATDYQADVDSAFGVFADHPAVHSVGDLLDRGARLEALMNTIVCHGPPPDLAKEYPYWTPDSTAVGTREEDRSRLLSAIRGFYRDTDFQGFWNLRWEELTDDVEEEGGTEEPGVPEETAVVEDSVGAESPLPLWTRGFEAVEESLYVLLHAEMAQEPYQTYYGSRGDAVYLFIPTLQSPSDTVLATRSYGRELLAWIAPLSPDSVALWDRSRLDPQRAREMGIAVVEPLAEWLWPYLAEYQYLFEYLMRGRGRLGLWDSWGECFVEHLRRAVNARVIRSVRGEHAAEGYLDAREEEGYGLIRILHDRLEDYEADRGRYLSLPDFCPVLISALGNVRAEVGSREAAFGVTVRGVDSGLLVTRVFKGLAAERAGVAVGDTLIRVGGVPVEPDVDLEARARTEGVGGRIEIQVERNGRVRDRVLLLGADLIIFRFSRDDAD